MDRLLVAKANGDLVKDVPLEGLRAMTIGRSDRCDLVLQAPSISRRHALLFKFEDQWHLADTGSRTGLKTPSGRIQFHSLFHDDWVRIGPAFLWLESRGNSRASVGHSAFDDPEISPVSQQREGMSASVNPRVLSSSRPGATLSIIEPESQLIRRVAIKPESDLITIGRSSSCDLTLTDPAISRLHCALYREMDRWCLVDAGSSAGVHVGEHRFLRKRLENGLVARCGKCSIWLDSISENKQMSYSDTSSGHSRAA